MQYLPFCAWLISLSITSSRFNFYFHSIIVKEETLYNFNLLKCIETYFCEPIYIVYSGECSTSTWGKKILILHYGEMSYICKNYLVYSAVQVLYCFTDSLVYNVMYWNFQLLLYRYQFPFIFVSFCFIYIGALFLVVFMFIIVSS